MLRKAHFLVLTAIVVMGGSSSAWTTTSRTTLPAGAPAPADAVVAARNGNAATDGPIASAPAAEVAGSPERIAIGLYPFSTQGGWVATRKGAIDGYSAGPWTQLPWAAYNLTGGGTHVAAGDVDGDGLDELVVGLGSGGQGWIAVFDDAAHGYALLKWIQIAWPQYNAANGETWPAVGDIDGDGRAEIVAGLGQGSQGYFQIFDDAAASFASIAFRQVSWPAYTAGPNGSTHPAVANLDGTGTSEIVLGLGQGGGGWVEVYSGFSAGISHQAWVQVAWPTFNNANGATYPAAGDVDGDGRAEIVVGLGNTGGGWLEILEDANSSYAHLFWLRTTWDAYNTFSTGETHPAVGSVDGDTRAEIVIGLAPYINMGGWVEIRDDASATYASLGFRNTEWTAYATSGGGTFPAVGLFDALAPPSITPNVTTAAAASTITFTAADGPGNRLDWVAFFCPASSADNTFVDWGYLNNSKTPPATGVTGGNVTFTAPSVPTGTTCNGRFFTNNVLTKLATSTTVNILASGPGISLNVTSGVPGTAVTATLTNSSGAAGDFLAVALTSSANSVFVRSVPVGAGVTTRTWSFPLPAAGTYEVRLLNGATRLSTSASVTSAGTACTDTDADGICDLYETGTGTYVSPTNTGTSQNLADTDGDGLRDGDEVFGTANGLDLFGLGARPVKKNLMMEYDWFDDNGVDPNFGNCAPHSHVPTTAIINRVTAAFAAAPVSNPDGTTGITMINDFGQGGLFTGGNFVSHAGNITGGVNDADFQAVKTANFATNRRGYFHYVIMSHWYTQALGSSGQAELPGNDLIVSLGCFGSTNNVGNTIMHELGHNLFLQHGGNESCNWKPNYNSVMNYRFQFPGIDTSGNAIGNNGEVNVLSYSTGSRISLNENNLNEAAGTTGTIAIDWNASGTITSGLQYDLNRASETSTAPAIGVDNSFCAATLQVLNDFNDWANIVFTGINDGDGLSLVPRPVVSCTNPIPRDIPEAWRRQ